ncbi:sortase [Candidatus Dojkabacteria bacterium]|nr:sortase [Candidatus Dojkabacteria bacterium]
MENEEKDSTTKVIFILFILSFLIVSGLFLYTKARTTHISLISVFLKGENGRQKYGYNFLVPSMSEVKKVEEEKQKSSTEDTSTAQDSQLNKEKIYTRDDILSPEQQKFAFDTKVTTGVIGELIIPKINVRANVFGGSDGDSLMDQGFWMYPSSSTPGNGETIVLCHRRYFQQDDPRSCWNINLLEKGDLIQVNDPSGKPIRYSVRSVTIKNPNDVNIYETSKRNFIKIISCSLQSGVPGGSDNRIVVIALEL